MGKHEPTKAQEKAFKDVISAIKKAKKAGLVFYAKQWNLVAYRKEADDYLESFNFSEVLSGKGSVVEYLSDNVLSDSGADDYGRYISFEDEEKYN